MLVGCVFHCSVLADCLIGLSFVLRSSVVSDLPPLEGLNNIMHDNSGSGRAPDAASGDGSPTRSSPNFSNMVALMSSQTELSDDGCVCVITA